jgi:hypothetical protein
MEVHHHSHTAVPDLHRGKKKWTHYFWEFFMLFLAVTLGFLVENWREHYIEHQRAKVYARSMRENLQDDTAELNRSVYAFEIATRNLDSFLVLITETDFRQIPTGKLYWYGLWGGYFRGFEPNDATFQQMKNSGSLRYLNNSELEKKIGEYDQILRSIRALGEIDRPVFLETRKARARIFDFKYNNAANQVVQRYIWQNGSRSGVDSFMLLNPPLLSTDKLLFNEYAELCRSRNLRPQLRNLIEANNLATAIIGLLEKEFHLK